MGLRVLSWNVQMRSWAMQVGASPGYTIPPIDTGEERARIIAKKLIASPWDDDIVGVCEVFDEDCREILSDELKTRFPHQIVKCDYATMTVREPSGESTVDLLLAWDLIGLPGAVTNSYRLEDSGLMLFSRFPFARVSTSTVSERVRQLMILAGLPIPLDIPRVSFYPYTDTAGHDGDACKGMAYAGVRQWSTAPVTHTFVTHTQADTNVVEENRTAREEQLRKAAAFVDVCAGGAPFGEEVIVMGDLNVCGEPGQVASRTGEWRHYFGSPGHRLTDDLVDLFGAFQCQGGTDLRDPGYTATVRYDPMEQRLDYMIGSRTSVLAAQHIWIDYDLAQVPSDAPDDVSYLSDHRPLRADFAVPRVHSTPTSALILPVDAASPDAADPQQWIWEGQVAWYLLKEAGTYDIAVDSNPDRPVRYAVYLDTDLSRPRQQYRQERHPDYGDKFVLNGAPILIKVYPRDRHGEQDFSIRVHRHTGAGPDDMIHLDYGRDLAERFPSSGQVVCLNHPVTDWDDTDSKWFRLDAPRLDLGEVSGTVSVSGSGLPFRVRIARSDGAGGWRLEADESAGRDPVSVPVTMRPNDIFLVQVARQDGLTPRDFTATLRADIDLSILLGGPPKPPVPGAPDDPGGNPRLVCVTETSGWGADDIDLVVNVDGRRLLHADNDSIGDFDQDDIRDLGQYLDPVVPYREGVEFVVKEIDDIGRDDIGRKSLPPYADLLTSPFFDLAPGAQPAPDGRIRGRLKIVVDDGVYGVDVTVVRWDERL